MASASVLTRLPCQLPSVSIPDDVDAEAIATDLAPNLNHLQESNFQPDAIWRDTFALTGTSRTFYSASSVITAWRETTSDAKAEAFKLDSSTAKISRMPNGSTWLDCQFTFEAKAPPSRTCMGIISMVPDQVGEWRIWVLRTILNQLKGQRNADVLEPLVHRSISNGHTVVNGDSATQGLHEQNEFQCVVAGGGQAGLSVGGRFKALGLSYVILDSHPNVGDSWKSRYRSARLHTPREYAHLPFDRTFPSTYQEFLTKDDLARGYAAWVEKFGINVWQQTSLISGNWNATDRKWSLMIQRGQERQQIRCQHLVLAIGPGGQTPVAPQYPEREKFRGTVLHSHEYTDPSAFRGKNGIVIGTANTAHDVADDMVQAGLASVWMVQRSPTYVLPCEYYQRSAARMYNSDVPTEYADMIQNTGPMAVGRLLAQMGLNGEASREPERFDALERAGFKTERYGDIMWQIYERMGGHYMDVGTSAKIANGQIKIKSNALPARYTASGLEFEDGDHFDADLIVFATGFEQNMRSMIKRLLGSEVASQVSDFWGLDEEGEIKGAYKPCGHPNLWLHGGTQGIARYFSRFIALQIQADLLGSSFEVYGRKLPQGVPN